MPSAFEKYSKVTVPRYTSYPTAPHFSTHFPANAPIAKGLPGSIRLSPFRSICMCRSASSNAGTAAAT
jgi:hypothetical protein